MSFFSILLVVAAWAAGQANLLVADIAWVAKGEFCEPETVLPLPDNTLLVSNVCGFGDPGSGFLSLLAGDGDVIDWRVVDGLDAPLGMALLGDRLYLVDNNRVKIFGWPGYQLLDIIVLDTSVANDLSVAPNGIIYVTDTAKNRVMEILPDGSQSVFTGQAQFKGANGIEFHSGQVYIGGQRLWRVDLESHSVETIGPDWLTDIDGIEFEPDGTLQITPVGGPLIRYYNDLDIEVFAGDGVSSANHGYSGELKLALIPTGFDNTVIAVRVGGKSTAAHSQND